MKRSQSQSQLIKTLTKFNINKLDKPELKLKTEKEKVVPEYWPNDQKKQQTGKHFDTMNTWNTREIIGNFPKER